MTGRLRQAQGLVWADLVPAAPAAEGSAAPEWQAEFTDYANRDAVARAHAAGLPSVGLPERPAWPDDLVLEAVPIVALCTNPDPLVHEGW